MKRLQLLAFSLFLLLTACSEKPKTQTESTDSIDVPKEVAVIEEPNPNLVSAPAYDWLIGKWECHDVHSDYSLEILDFENSSKGKYSVIDDMLIVYESDGSISYQSEINPTNRTIHITDDIYLYKYETDKMYFRQTSQNETIICINFLATRRDKELFKISNNLYYKEDGTYNSLFIIRDIAIPSGKTWVFKGCNVQYSTDKAETFTINSIPTVVTINGNSRSYLFDNDGEVRNYNDGSLLGTGRLDLEGGDVFQMQFDSREIHDGIYLRGSIYFIEKP